MNLSFYRLFSVYAKHSQRYFTPIAETSYDYTIAVEILHKVLIQSLSNLADTLAAGNSTCANLSAYQIRHLVTAFAIAHAEMTVEEETNNKIHSVFNPDYFSSLDKTAHLKEKRELAGYYHLCPVEEGESV